jgi:acyl carrier protein
LRPKWAGSGSAGFFPQGTQVRLFIAEVPSCRYSNSPKFIPGRHIIGRINRPDTEALEPGGLFMTSLSSSRRISTVEEVSLATKICVFIAEQLHVDVKGITTNSHFSDDLGLDLLDVIELTILLENHLTNVRIEDTAGQMEFVGDLICQLR